MPKIVPTVDENGVDTIELTGVVQRLYDGRDAEIVTIRIEILAGIDIDKFERVMDRLPLVITAQLIDAERIEVQAWINRDQVRPA